MPTPTRSWHAFKIAEAIAELEPGQQTSARSTGTDAIIVRTPHGFEVATYSRTPTLIDGYGPAHELLLAWTASARTPHAAAWLVYGEGFVATDLARRDLIIAP